MDVAEQDRARERSGAYTDVPGTSSARASSAPPADINPQPRESVKELEPSWVIIFLLVVAYVLLQV